MKQRFSSLDVKVIAHELSSSLVTLRIANIYDLSTKIFLFKFSKPDNKQSLLVDSGFRCHLTAFTRTAEAAPSPFVARLRKYLKTRRVTSIAQVGTDRIIEFQFSDGQYRLFLEFYAGGNIILTDKELNILALLRDVSEVEAQEKLRVGLKYSLEDRQNFGGIPPLTKERLKGALQKAVDRQDENATAGKVNKKKSGVELRKALAVSITEFPPMLVDHAMRVVEFDSTLKPEEVLQNESLLDHLMKSLKEAHNVIQEITSASTTKGFIIAKKSEKNAETSTEAEGSGNLLYEDFHPFQPQQFADDPSLTFLPFEGFNKTVDEFFSSIEGQRLEGKLQERELTAKRKIQAARQDQAKRLGGLQEIQAINDRKAGAIEINIERVQEAMDAVNGLVAQGMDWVEIGKLIELQQKKQNPVAQLIKLPLKLEENTITLLLNEGEEDDDFSGDETDSAYYSSGEDEEESKKPEKKPTESRLSIDINLGISPWGNAREYYDNRRSAAVKEQKTLQSSIKALKSTEQKIALDLQKGLKQEKAILRPVRRQMWFEKFIYFISSDGYLVLGGKDAQQNEILYKKYLRKGDYYVHADLQGAATIVIRNNLVDSPIPPSTLSQAGTLAVASSSAWDSKAGMSAWWVTADQVSKSAPTGEFLPTGSFMVKGKKNFLPPAPLLLGFGILFQISEESKVKHLKHRIRDDQSTFGGSFSTQSVEPSTEIDNDSTLGGSLTTNSLESSTVGDGSDDSEDEGTIDPEEGEHAHEEEKEDEEERDTLDDADGEENDDRPSNPLQSHNIQSDLIEETSDELKDLNIKDDSDDEDAIDSADESGQETPSSAMLSKGKGKEASTPSVTSTQKGPTPLPRGKRSKAKKIAAKYKDQDEEDRLAAQALIGAVAGREKAEAEAKAKAQHEADLAFQKERRRAQHARTQKQVAEHEELRKAMLEEGLEMFDEDEVAKSTNLDQFVGTPLTGDEILEAIPVCAPWAAMGKYKYKVKIQPGSQKKGKAIKEVLAKLVIDSQKKGKIDEKSEDVERMWPREVELIRGMKVEECVGVVPVGKVRVMMAGGSSGASSAAKGKGKGGGGSGGGKGGKKGGR